MEFILLLAISIIPFIIAISILFFSKTPLSKALSLFLLMLSFWQIDIAILYADELLSLATIDGLFRLFRMGSIFIMPLMYFFPYHLIRENPQLKRFKLFFNRKGLFIVVIYSMTVYLVNFTELGVKSFTMIEETPLSPSHLLPVYGVLNSTFIVSILLVFMNTFLLLAVTLKLKAHYYKSFYCKLVWAAVLIFTNGVLSGFTFIPLYLSSFNSILIAIILFLGFFQMQSDKINRINRKLTRQSELLEAIMNINPNYLLVKNSQNQIVKVNDSFCDLLSTAREELLGRDFRELLTQTQMIESDYKGIQKFIDSKGEVYYIQWGYKELHEYPGEAYTLFFGLDVTEQKQNEQLLLSSEKLKVIGEMAASVAHEIRNPLTTIRGFIQLLKERSSQSEFENLVLEEIDRINQVLKELLILAKPEAKEHKAQLQTRVNLAEEMKNINLLFEAMAMEQNKEIVLVNRLETFTHVLMEKAHLKQVIINVIKNSLEAIPKEGKVKIILDHYHEENIRIRVIDNGEGISKKRLSRIGEPFYTSKEKGTGIGLTICFKLISDNNGEMRIKSKEKWGTVMTIILKAAS
ncbi:ATP-binding protein [Rossellomorea sp. BNER]|uniref:ATP-binding protein n=1 Tax=Rossellomorea sp. BNER TaxID=2962031 RepID=UPI003AF28DCE|nr:ATP-binding protein [Rossellomorea sp. BNER]